jgi:hypothetical protein
MNLVMCLFPPREGSSCSRPSDIDHQNTESRARSSQWVRITAMHHPLVGQVLRLVRRLHRDSGIDLVVEGTDGRRQLIPLAWTEVARVEVPTMPSLLFSPGSLRALVRLVRSHRTATPAEVRHANRPEPDALEHVSAGDPRPHDRSVDRSAAPTAAKPGRPGEEDTP